MANRQYKAALDYLNDIPPEAPEYQQAQPLIITAHKSMVAADTAQADQAHKRKDALTKQYEKLCHSGLYLYQIEERLQKENFQMDHSGFEKAPDGSNGVRRYFSKRTNDGFVIRIWLQSAYSMSYYYCNVEVEGN